ncbi:hypothetical protein D9M71_157120 [compost metagenome]
MIAFELFFQGAQYLALVLFIFHVDEVDDDDSADVAQAQLPGNGCGRLEVGLEDGLFEVAMADEGPGVDVDGGHRFGRVDHQIATGLERHLAVQRALDFVFDPVQVENRPLTRIVFKAVGDLRHQFGDKLRGFLEGFPRVDSNFLDLRADQVTQGTQGQAQVFVDFAGCPDCLDLRAYLVPEPAQVTNIHEDFIGTGALGCGAQDKAARFDDALLGYAITDHLLEALALGFVFDFQGNADVAGARHVHQVPRRNRKLRGQPGPFGANRILGDLDHQALALMHQGADGFHRRPLAHGDFRGMNERRAIQANIDEGRLHARQHPHDLALVDIADDPAPLGALDMHFLQNTVFYHCHARFHRRDIDQNLFTHGSVSSKVFTIILDRVLAAGKVCC